jgi:hypothetical protein
VARRIKERALVWILVGRNSIWVRSLVTAQDGHIASTQDVRRKLGALVKGSAQTLGLVSNTIQ